MKRIPSKIAVSTLIGLLHPKQKVIIRDFNTRDAIIRYDMKQCTERFNGEVGELHSYKWAKETASQIYKLEPLTNTTIVIFICTAEDTY